MVRSFSALKRSNNNNTGDSANQPEHLNRDHQHSMMTAIGHPCQCSHCQTTQVTNHDGSAGPKNTNPPSSSLSSTINIMNIIINPPQQQSPLQSSPRQTLNVNLPASSSIAAPAAITHRCAPRSLPRDPSFSANDNDDSFELEGDAFIAAPATGGGAVEYQTAAAAAATTSTNPNNNMNDTNAAATGCSLHPSGSGDESSRPAAAAHSSSRQHHATNSSRVSGEEEEELEQDVALGGGGGVLDRPTGVSMYGTTAEWDGHYDYDYEDQDQDHDSRASSRGGPTPTNDLIRALIHRDRMAILTATPAALASPSPSGASNSNSPVTMASVATDGQTLEPSPLATSGHLQPIDHSIPLASSSAAAAPPASGTAERGNRYQRRKPPIRTTSGKPKPPNTANNDDTTKASGLAPAPIHSNLEPGNLCASEQAGPESFKSHHQHQNQFPKPEERNEKASDATKRVEGNTSQKQHQQQSKRFDLASLIGKCQALQLSDGVASSLAPGYQLALRTLRSVSPRRPSEAPRLSTPDQPDEASAASGGVTAAAATTQRRHSTYMFPLLMNQVPQTSDDDDDDDQDDEEEDQDDYDSNCDYGERDAERPQGGRQVVRADDDHGGGGGGGNAGGRKRGQLGAAEMAGGADASSIYSNNININNKNPIVSSKISGSSGRRGNNNSSKLRNSTSSPSALSTPTNDRLDGGGGGCGGPCCVGSNAVSKQAQPQAEIGADGGHHHSPGQNQFQGGLSQQQTVKIANGQEKLRKLSSGSSQCTSHGNRKVSMVSSSPACASSEQTSAACGGLGEQLDRRGRRRIGSGPSEALRMGEAGGGGQEVQQQSASGQLRCLAVKQQQQSVASSAKVKNHLASGKRHSLISVLSGVNQQVGGNHLVSRLAHPRSLFSNNNNNNDTHHNKPYNHRQQRASVECAMMVEPQYDPLIPESGFKIVVMGASGSGKTSIIQRFIYNSFSWRHNPTVEDTYFIEFPYMKNTINISISDTSGTYQFPAMRRLAINSGDAFILVYSVDNPNSLEDLKLLRQNILDEREQAYSEVSASMISNESSSSGLASGSSQTSVSFGAQHQQQQPQQLQSPSQSHQPYLEPVGGNPSPLRHWSLASIFNSHHHNQHNHHHQLHQEQHHLQQQQQFRTMQGHLANHSLNSSICSSSLSCSSSADNSRRSSVSAAEAALKTRRTPHPPMVIVGNKQDLPDEQHLVDSDEIQMQAQMDWNNGFVRASAALNLNIDEIFQQVMKQAKQPPTLTEAIVSKRRKSLPPKLPH